MYSIRLIPNCDSETCQRPSVSSRISRAVSTFSCARTKPEPYGFEHAWAMRIKNTQPNAPVEEFSVHFIAFASGISVRTSDAILAGLPWPNTIERSASCRRAEFVFGRLAARHALAQLSPALVNALVPIGGDREPLWPVGILGSITHVSGLAGAAVVPASSWRHIGIDLEQTARGDAQQALRTLALDSTELGLLQRPCDVADQSDLDTRVTHVFSAKEFLYKAAFPTVRRFFGFSAARLCAYEFFSPGHGPEIRLALEMTEEVGGEFVMDSRWWVEVWRLQGSNTCLSVLAC